MKKMTIRLLILGLIFASASSAVAAEDSWKHDVQPYLWLPSSVEGTSTVEGGTIGLGLDTSDVIDLLNFAFSIRYEAWKEKYGLFVDGMYVELQGDFNQPAPTPPGGTFNVKPDIKQVVIDFAGAYRLTDTDWTTDVFGGLRYTYLKQDITLVHLTLPVSGNPNGTEDYIEPMFGARVAWSPSERWHLAFRGDMSGFGIGNGSDLTWNALLGADYKPWKSASLKLGYRVYDINYSTGSGADEFGLDIRAHGPYLGASFYF